MLIYPEYKDGSRNRLKDVLKQVHTEVQPQLNGRFDWPEEQFPCSRGDLTACHQLTEPFDSPTDPPSSRLDQREHQNADASGNPLGTGAGYRQCLFYKRFRDLISQSARLPCPPAPPPSSPPASPPPAAQPAEPQYRMVPGEPIVTKETVGEYHPPEGEHYGYYMDRRVRTGVTCNPEFAPTVAVAPNKKENADDFNLIKAGPIRVVKMDIGFWGEQRAKDVSRKSGVKRVPARYFGMMEGQFVFLCYFQTPDNAGFVKGCSEDFDEKLTPLCAKLAKAVKDAGHKILIMAKAVADDGPDEKKLNVFFPDMHLPRKFDEKDPEYATADCIFRVQMVKSMVLHQLKRDYRLPAEQTPWLAVQDRQLCRDFFEHGAEKLKLPHWNTGRRFSNPFDPAGSDVVSAAADAVKKAYQALMQVGYYMFEFTQDDYRRMVRKYNEEFPEKGYGRTWDVLFNWFYGFETDKNRPPPQKSGVGEEAKSMIPAIVSEVADTNFGTKLGPDAGTKPATESYDRVDAAPARDLLRFLKVMSEQRRKAGLQIQVFQTGDLCELWANRRYLFEDFEETDDPGGQMPSIAKSLTPSDSSSSGGGTLAAVGSALKTYGLPIVRTFLQIMLGGINAGEHNLWFRRECNKPADSDDPEHPEQDRLPSEESWNVNSIDDDFMLPQFTGPGRSPGAVGLATDPAHPLKTPSVNYTNVKLNELKKSKERRKGYLTAEAERRLGQIADFEAPLRQDASGKREDQELLGGNVGGKNKDQGKWNRAVLEKFAELGTKFIYGNHDDYRGVPRNGGLAQALPFYSELGLWAEHAHRFEDSNLDGQPFGAFITSLAYDIQELAFGEGLLDEYALHREQSNFQPGILQWFLLTEFGLDTLKDFQEPPEHVPPVSRFRIAVNSHTHVPDLVVAQIIFKEREKTPWEAIINYGGAALKGLLLIKQVVDWYNKWKDHHGFEKWWEDIQGNTINWGVDFAGLSKCVDKALDFINKGYQTEKKKLKDEWDASRRSLKQAVDDNARNLGLPPR